MSTVSIQARDLGKRYTLGASESGYGRLSESLSTALRSRFRRHEEADKREMRTIWALRDVSFDIQEGEVVGVVGRNGAGKSTLLKILARVTEPSEGRAVLRGRVGSLLEVGTGFHYELTGRENTYLSGKILGMTHAEVDAKFDEIVEFAEMERFIDTPVKRYSSGMFLRLAFSVAAHLNPAILLVDEVLAVGDVKFREKCLARIGEVSHEGRTVLFVSHDLTAIVSTCARALLIDGGRLRLDGPARDVAAEYEGSGLALASSGGRFRRDLDAVTTRTPVFLSAVLSDAAGAGTTRFGYGDPLELQLATSADAAVPDFSVDWQIVDARRHPVAHGSSVLLHSRYFSAGETVRLRIDSLPLAAGRYGIDLSARVPGITEFDQWQTDIGFEVDECDPFSTGTLYHAREGLSQVVLSHGWGPATRTG
jgi:lipopolysaccharide transport system ATP-binding protein